MQPTSERPTRLLLPLLGAGAIVAHVAWLAGRYPTTYLDPDLLAALIYFRDGNVTLPAYFIPKLLPTVLLGAVGDPWAAALLGAGLAALGAALAVRLAQDAFGAAAAAVALVALALEPQGAILALHGGADLMIGVALLGFMIALRRRAVGIAAGSVLLAALVKPVAAACVLVLILVPAVPFRRRLAAVALVLALAVGAHLAFHALLLGDTDAWTLATRFLEVTDIRPRGWMDQLRFILIELVGWLLPWSWPLLVLGALHCVVAACRAALGRPITGPPLGWDRGTLIIVVPVLLLVGYVLLSLLHPLVIFVRFVWVLEVAMLLLAAHAAARCAAWSRLPSAGRAVLLVAAVAVLGRDLVVAHGWHLQSQLDAQEQITPVVEALLPALEAECTGTTAVPLGWLPLAGWRLRDRLLRGELCSVEDWAARRGCATPTCVMAVPAAANTAAATQAVRDLPRLPGARRVARHGQGALVRLRDTGG